MITYEEYQKQIAILRELAKDLSPVGENAYFHQLDRCNQMKNQLIAQETQ